MKEFCLALAAADAVFYTLLGLLTFAIAVGVASIVLLFVADRRRSRTVRRYEARLRRQSAPDYECEDCVGMREHGCYCQAMGARQPGGPL